MVINSELTNQLREAQMYKKKLKAYLRVVASIMELMDQLYNANATQS
jgi:hypothetical protein